MNKKRLSRVLLCEFVRWRDRDWYHVVYFPSVNLDHYLIPVEKFKSDVPERVYNVYKIGYGLISYIIDP